MDLKPLAVAILAITLTACGKQDESAQEAGETLTDRAATLADEGAQSAQEMAESTARAVDEAADSAAETGSDMIESAQETGQAAMDTGAEALEDAGDKLAEAGETASETAAAAAGQDSDPAAGESVYKANCFACHGAGVAGAPKLGDSANWAPRIEQGMDVLYTHAIEGYQGESGYMPPKGGFTSLSDEEVKAAVQYMVEESR
ncbi:sulfite dehydrogenase cytochrome subunit SoxD [Thiohalobacter thiocyanaticus]|uniref:Sulfite dehydrogenase cytochrome subunit SoxD n=1 Tax=Thiohalobacter thiocyanaticus TaxID=585455 RepID=A0A1Z4VN58_9GAMM|nr:c-type cytochrome [Thiohalobacter thiocyanaticus]BAZ93066.1 sulfite dehydrogenase cytochrome subunit SoxD [Thiohalobacter thiocyanaticus]